MSAFTPVRPAADVEGEPDEEIEEIEVDVVDVELEDDEDQTLTSVEGIVIRSAPHRPESWPQNKRLRPPSPAATELGEDSDGDEDETAYPKVVLKFEGKLEGASTRARTKNPTKVRRRGHRSVEKATMDLNAREAPLDDAASSSNASPRATVPGPSGAAKRVGSQLGGPEDQAYWKAHVSFVNCPAGAWLHNAAKPGFTHSSVAMMNICKEAYHVMKATPTDCPFQMGETDIDHLKYLRTAVVGYKRRLEKGMGSSSTNRVGGLSGASADDGVAGEEEGEEEEERIQIVDAVEVTPGSGLSSSSAAMDAMQKMLKDQQDQIVQLKQAFQLQQVVTSASVPSGRKEPQNSAHDPVLMAAPVPESAQEAAKSAQAVRAFLESLPVEIQTRAHQAAIAFGKHPNAASIDEWVRFMTLGPLGKHKAYTVKIAIILALNPDKSCTWAYMQVGTRASHTSTIISMAYNLRMHSFTRESLEKRRDSLPDYEDDTSVQAHAGWQRNVHGVHAPASAPAAAPASAPAQTAGAAVSLPQFTPAAVQVMAAAAAAASTGPLPTGWVEATDAASGKPYYFKPAVPKSSQWVRPTTPAHPPALNAAVQPRAWTVDASGTVAPATSPSLPLGAVRVVAHAAPDVDVAPITPAEFAVLKRKHPDLDLAFREIALREDLSDAQKKTKIMVLVSQKEKTEAATAAATAAADAATAAMPAAAAPAAALAAASVDLTGPVELFTSQAQLEANVLSFCINLSANNDLSANELNNEHLLRCLLLLGAIQEDRSLSHMMRRRISEKSHSMWFSLSNSTNHSLHICKCIVLYAAGIVGEERLLAAANTIKKRGSRGMIGRARLQVGALKQFKAEKHRAVSAGMAANDFPLLATWCESLWNQCTEEQRNKLTCCVENGWVTYLLAQVGRMIRA